MEERTINLELPLIKVTESDLWINAEFAKENFPKGCFILDDGYNYHFVRHDGEGYINEMSIDRDLILGAIVENVRSTDFSIIEMVKNRLEQIARLCGETKDQVVKSEVRMSERFDQQYAQLHVEYSILKEKVSDMPKGGSGIISILDIAKAAAVIQKPELIEKL